MWQYKIDLEKYSHITFDMTATSNTLDAYLYLLKREGFSLLTSWKQVAFDDNGFPEGFVTGSHTQLVAGGTDARIAGFFEAGEYIVALTSPDGTGTGAYEFSVVVEEPIPYKVPGWFKDFESTVDVRSRHQADYTVQYVLGTMTPPTSTPLPAAAMIAALRAAVPTAAAEWN